MQGEWVEGVVVGGMWNDSEEGIGLQEIEVCWWDSVFVYG